MGGVTQQGIIIILKKGNPTDPMAGGFAVKTVSLTEMNQFMES